MAFPFTMQLFDSFMDIIDVFAAHIAILSIRISFHKKTAGRTYSLPTVHLLVFLSSKLVRLSPRIVKNAIKNHKRQKNPYLSDSVAVFFRRYAVVFREQP